MACIKNDPRVKKSEKSKADIKDGDKIKTIISKLKENINENDNSESQFLSMRIIQNRKKPISYNFGNYENPFEDIENLSAKELKAKEIIDIKGFQIRYSKDYGKDFIKPKIFIKKLEKQLEEFAGFVQYLKHEAKPILSITQSEGVFILGSGKDDE